ncbi:TetR family transcriptional regulator [Rathayibacter caricis]|uniref:TetR/AcrR family transcriptional regulator n=1 Tax=Rathayibacter caricis TaxID=110936 RepID=UPI001FB56109|nr:TetR family transcriptional regulator [Rathayibacter caricis]MCJ1697749.1 TetR family transcriptional regulator [Rathayibacter caricis]
MAWDTRRTRSVLLEAAVEEFSRHGFAGARVARISERAGINRERLYSYFGNKEQLFEAVLESKLAAVLDSIPVRGEGPAAVGEFAGRYFDACSGDPALARLVMWEGLEFGGPVARTERSVRAARKAAELNRAVPGLPEREGRELLLMIVTLCHGWQAAPNVASIIVSGDAADRRAWIVRAVSALASSSL